jgi:hypothetical protein
MESKAIPNQFKSSMIPQPHDISSYFDRQKTPIGTTLQEIQASHLYGGDVAF